MEKVKFAPKESCDAYKKYIDEHIKFVTSDNQENIEAYKKATKEFYQVDPDSYSKELIECHQAIWQERPLPKNNENNKFGNLVVHKDSYNRYCLTKKFRFTSDIIVTSFIGYEKRNKKLKDKFKEIIASFDSQEDYKNTIWKKYLKEFYNNIGSFIIFPPKPQNSINCVRGRSPINDRFDLTLECIRRYYAKEKSPLDVVFKKTENETSNETADFFDLFGNFQGYVEFFCLNDLVELNNDNPNLSHVKSFLADGTKEKAYICNEDFDHPFPNNVDEYLRFMDNQLAFIKNRTKLIKDKHNEPELEK